MSLFNVIYVLFTSFVTNRIYADRFITTIHATSIKVHFFTPVN